MRANIRLEPLSLDIVKENQAYQLIVAYNYIGSYIQSNRYLEEVLEEVQLKLPLGYAANRQGYGGFWNDEDKKQYWLLFMIIGIIFFICSVLLESLRQPLAVIFMIPLSYIGLFLTFYLFDLNFDQGGFAALILLSGITVNSALYIINDYNNLKLKKRLSARQLYLKAYNHKIFPILLTILSTVFGLIPFLAGGQNDALAAGTIGGLVFSLVGIVFFLPIVLIKKCLLLGKRKPGVI